MKILQWGKTRYSPVVFGIGPRDLHLVQLKETGGICVLSASADTRISEGEDRGRAIREAALHGLRSAPFKGKKGSICLMGEDVFIQHHRLSKDSRGRMEEKLYEELQQSAPMELKKAELRYISTGKVYERNEACDEIILMAAERSVIHRYLGLLDELKMTPVMVGVEPVSMLHALVKLRFSEEETEGIVGFLNMAGSKTELIVTRNGGLAFTRSIPLGSDRFTTALAEKLGIGLEDAGRLKKALSMGKPINDTLRSAAWSAFRPMLETLCSEVRSCFRYFASTFNREAVDRLIVAGQEITGVLDPLFMERLVGVPVQNWNPKIHGVKNRTATSEGGIDSAPVPLMGLALESLSPSDGGVNFMLEEVLESRRKSRSLRSRLAAAGLLILALCLLQAVVLKRQSSMKKVSSLFLGERGAMQVKSERMVLLDSLEKKLVEEKGELLDSRPGARISRILAEIARSAGDGIHFSRLSMQKGRLSGAGESIGARSAIVLRIEGLALGGSDLAEFREALETTRAFSSIRQEGFEDMPLGEHSVKRFTMVLTVGLELLNEIV